MSELTAKEFAEKYGGCQVSINHHALPISLRLKSEFDDHSCRIVGYCIDNIEKQRDIVVWFENYKSHYAQDGYVSTTSNWDGISGWRVTRDELSLLEEPLSNKPVKAYPNKCPRCHSPSRNRGGLIFCSNTKCKKAAEIRRRFYCASVKVAGLDAAKFAICPKCHERSTMTAALTADLSNGQNRRLTCQHNHEWTRNFVLGERMQHFGSIFEWGRNDWNNIGVVIP